MEEQFDHLGTDMERWRDTCDMLCDKPRETLCDFPRNIMSWIESGRKNKVFFCIHWTLKQHLTTKHHKFETFCTARVFKASYSFTHPILHPRIIQPRPNPSLVSIKVTKWANWANPTPSVGSNQFDSWRTVSYCGKLLLVSSFILFQPSGI